MSRIEPVIKSGLGSVGVTMGYERQYVGTRPEVNLVWFVTKLQPSSNDFLKVRGTRFFNLPNVYQVT